MSRLEGKVAIVTGASSGIGLAITQTLVREGMKVVGLARRKQKMVEEMKDVEGKGSFFPIECDISNRQSVEAAFEWILENLEVVHVLINNAGIVKTGSIVDTSREQWEEVFNVNVMGLLECTKRAVNIMQAADVEGYVVNINSVQGHRVYVYGKLAFNVYPASKYAVTAITESLQKELTGGKIRVTSISPGYVHTDIVKGVVDPEFLEGIPGMESQDIADAVLFVLSTHPRVQVSEMTLTAPGSS